MGLKFPVGCLASGLESGVWFVAHILVTPVFGNYF
jgi:hypothetical protein